MRASNQRAERLFGVQIEPRVQAKPVDFVPINEPGGRTFGTTTLNIVLYSNFSAFDVRSDVMYAYLPTRVTEASSRARELEWIGEWERAKVEDCKKKFPEGKKMSQECESYEEDLSNNVGNLIIEDDGVRATGWSNRSTPELKGTTGSTGTVMHLSKGGGSGSSRTDYLCHKWTGECLSEDEICKKNKQLIVAVRTTWENERQRKFEKIDHYVLRCTRAGAGRAFTFIPNWLSSENIAKAQGE
jgi:hypothetical protein